MHTRLGLKLSNGEIGDSLWESTCLARGTESIAIRLQGHGACGTDVIYACGTPRSASDGWVHHRKDPPYGNLSIQVW
jgi:hypothetical protein